LLQKFTVDEQQFAIDIASMKSKYSEELQNSKTLVDVDIPTSILISPWKYLRVVESAYDDKVCELMEEIQSLEDDLMIARSCLVYSEEMREIQYEQIKKLVEDIDVLKAELYHLKSNGN
jgi:wyosine [tRNA(Phe)-imidazoG37] synthetase (radical SAM superfamily)